MNKEIEYRAWLKKSYLNKIGYYHRKSYQNEKFDKLGRLRKVHSIHLNRKKVIVSDEFGGNISINAISIMEIKE